jgi:hypothetical protein
MYGWRQQPDRDISREERGSSRRCGDLGTGTACRQRDHGQPRRRRTGSRLRAMSATRATSRPASIAPGSLSATGGTTPYWSPGPDLSYGERVQVWYYRDHATLQEALQANLGRWAHAAVITGDVWFAELDAGSSGRLGVDGPTPTGVAEAARPGGESLALRLRPVDPRPSCRESGIEPVKSTAGVTV